MTGSGDELDRLAALFQEHRSRLEAMVERRIDPSLRRRIDAAEVLQDAFLAAQNKWRRARNQVAAGSDYAWLYRIVLDQLIEAYRKEFRERRDPGREVPWPEQSAIQLGFGLVATATTPSEAVARRELQSRMQNALEQLSHTDREILWMRHFDELSFAEAGTVLGLSENAATVRYVRALKRLREIWQGIEETP